MQKPNVFSNIFLKRRFTIMTLEDFPSLLYNTIGFSDGQCSVNLYKCESSFIMAKQILVVKFHVMR